MMKMVLSSQKSVHTSQRESQINRLFHICTKFRDSAEEVISSVLEEWGVRRPTGKVMAEQTLQVEEVCAGGQEVRPSQSERRIYTKS